MKWRPLILGALLLPCQAPGQAGPPVIGALPLDPRDQSLRAYLDREDFPGRIESVRVTSETIHISGTVSTHPAGVGLFLAEIRPHESVTQPAGGRYPRTFAIQPSAADGSFRFEIRRVLPIYDQIYSKWAVIARHDTDPSAADTLLSHAVHPTDLAEAALWGGLKPLVAKTRKGVGGIHPDPALLPDLADLGVGHLTHNIVTGSLLREHAGPDTIPHEYAGRTYHFSKPGVASIDRVTRFAQAHGIVVSAIILVPNIQDRTGWAGRILTHPDADPSGIYSMANVATFEGVNHYAAVMRFLAERYGPPEAPNGRITHWIIHNEVDSGWVWTNAGAKPAHAYLDDYAKSMRVAYHAVRSFDPHAKVFISLTHNWNRSHQPNNPRFYPSRQLLTILNRLSRVEGDFEWGLAFHPYPQSLFHPRTWEDKDALNGFDTPYITFRNIEVLDEWIRQRPFLYRGKKVRTILLSEQGFHTPDTTTASQDTQAAALAYAWKKIAPLEAIEAFHYHRWIDHEKEGGLNLGLWTVKPGTITLPNTKKRSWQTFQALGTATEEEAIEFAKPIIGISDWDAIKLKPDAP